MKRLMITAALVFGHVLVAITGMEAEPTPANILHAAAQIFLAIMQALLG